VILREKIGERSSENRIDVTIVSILDEILLATAGDDGLVKLWRFEL
jgi:hypothetical protein